MNDTISEIEQCHQHWLTITKADPNAKENQLAHYERCYYDLLQAGITAEEWNMILKYLKFCNKSFSHDKQRKLTPRKLIQAYDPYEWARFMDDLREARKWDNRMKARVISPAQQVVEEFRRCREPENNRITCASVREALAKAIGEPPK